MKLRLKQAGLPQYYYASSGLLAHPQIAQSGYEMGYEGSNKIGNKGVKYVVMTKLPQLEKLILGMKYMMQMRI